ncbi:hypothetical protein ACFQ0B_58220 [Nonomuraea thailandensis]
MSGASAAVEVRDDGRPAGGGEEAGGRGNGLTGLAERIGAAGGRLEVGTLPEGGYRLYAQVPVETS